MTDEAYTFVKDIRDKKSIAASAFRRNPGHHGCKLPYEAIPYAERHKLNGEVKTMNIDRPMKWDEFKALPDDIKVKYITRLRELYHANYRNIAEMLGIGSKYLNQIANGLRIDCYGQNGKVSRNRMTWQQKCSWAAFCNGVVGGSQKAEVQVEEPAEETRTIDIPKEKPKMASELLPGVKPLDIPEEVAGNLPDAPIDIQGAIAQNTLERLVDVMNKEEPKMDIPQTFQLTMTGVKSWESLMAFVRNIPIGSSGVAVTIKVEQ